MSETVLIADSHTARGREVAVACRGLGLNVHVVTHGAAALEYALTHKPLAMVTQLELPLIEGPRLAEILQANPHTQEMGVLFIDDEADGEQQTGPGVLPGRADSDTIARFISALISRRTRQVTPEEGAQASGIEGNLSQLAPTELIELFHMNRKTGVIELSQPGGRGAARGEISLDAGNIRHAQTGEVKGEKALFRLLRWRRGTFRFREESVAEAAGIDRPTRALLREAERQGEEWVALGTDLPPDHARVTLKVSLASLPNLLHPLTQEVLLVLEFSDRVQQVLDRCTYPDYQILRTLQTLARRGMIEIRTEAEETEMPAAGLFAPSVASRLRDWLDQGRGTGLASVDAKVAVISAEFGASQALAGLMARLPGVTVQEPPGESGIRALLRVPVDGEVGIDFISVPSVAGYAPAWPLAVHGALATLFLHTGPVDDSVRALRPAVEAVAALPRARAFHLLLEDKERAAADQLCERLGLFDDRFVACVPQEQPDAAVVALKELLARLLP